VQPGTTYSYSVWTYDGTTYSPAAAVTIGTTPDAVQGLAAAPSAGQVQLSWTNPAADDDVTGVRVCRADGTTPPPDPNGCAPLTDALVSSYADTTVQPGSVYSYSVWTHNAQQTYSGATTATVTTPANPVTALTLVSQADGVHLAWTNPADATLTGVEICRADGATAPSDPASCLVITDTTAGSYVDASAHTGTTYSYALFAHDGSVFATPASATISTVPGAVTGVARAASAPSQVTLTWTNPTDPNVTGVKICRSPPTTAPTDPTCSALADTNAGTFTDTNVHPGSVYTYTLFAHDAVPQYGPAATITVTA
jgi:hypothetical protein